MAAKRGKREVSEELVASAAEGVETAIVPVPGSDCRPCEIEAVHFRLRGWTYEEIGNELGRDRRTVSEWLDKPEVDRYYRWLAGAQKEALENETVHSARKILRAVTDWIVAQLQKPDVRFADVTELLKLLHQLPERVSGEGEQGGGSPTGVLRLPATESADEWQRRRRPTGTDD